MQKDVGDYMSRDTIKELIELVPEEDMDLLQRIIIKFIPTSEPTQDEIEAITRANESIDKNGTVSHDSINWD